MMHLPIAGVVSGGAAPSTLLNNLVSWWKLDEASGNRNDSHGSNHLSVVGAGSSQVAGKIGNAVRIAQSSTYLSSNSADFVTTGSFTFAGWVQFPSSVPYNKGILSKNQYVGGQSHYTLWTGTGNFGLYWQVANDSKTTFQVSAPNLSANTWHFYIAEYNAATKAVGLRVNNGSKSTTTLTGTFSDMTNGVPFMLGNYNGASGVQANQDETAFWGRVLTVDESIELWNGGDGLSYSDLAA